MEKNIFTDIFVCIDDYFMIMMCSYANYKKAFNPDYKFALIFPNLLPRGKYVKNLAEKYGGILLAEDALEKAHISCERVIIHSFGKKEWQSNLLKNISFKKTCFYADGLKNEFSAEKFSQEIDYGDIIFFGWIFKKPALSKYKNIEVVPIKYIVDSFRDLKIIVFSHLGKPTLNENFFENDKRVNLVFLRYWGRGFYEFKNDVDYGDACFKVLPKNTDELVFIKSDPRVLQSQVDSAFERIREIGIKAYKFEELFSWNGNIVDDFWAELFVDIIKNKNVVIHCFDSSLSVSTSAMSNAEVVFPHDLNLYSLFKKEEAIASILNWSSIYSKVIDKISDNSKDNAAVPPTITV